MFDPPRFQKVQALCLTLSARNHKYPGLLLQLAYEQHRIGKRDGKKSYSCQGPDKAQSRLSCPFCWFVLTIYPTLKGMTPRDEATFSEHLKKSHGLKQEILP